MTVTVRVAQVGKGLVRLTYGRELGRVFYEAQQALAREEIPGVQIERSSDDKTGGTVLIPRNALGVELIKRMVYHVEGGIAPCGVGTSKRHPSEKRALYPHQQIAVKFLLRNQGGFLADDMGLGKTTSAATACVRFIEATGVDGVRLIVGPGYVADTWANELYALGFVDDPRDVFMCLVGKDPKAPTRGWVFCPYHLMDKWAGAFTLRSRPRVSILDEVHWLKNPKARRTEATYFAAGVAPFVVALSGTPQPNRPNELWQPLTAVSGQGAWGNFFDFRRRYCGAVQNRYGWEDTEPTHTAELRQRLSTVYLRRTKSDVAADIPALTRQVHRAILPKRAMGQHAKILAGTDLRALLDLLVSGNAGKETLALLSGLRQLASDAKVKMTHDLVTDILANGEKVVVFCHRRDVAESLARPFDGGFAVHGGYPQIERDALIRGFQSSDGERPLDALFATYGALREGVTLHAASHVVMHELDWVLADMLQAEARVHRIGQTKPVTSHWMFCGKSFDDICAQALTVKACNAGETLSDGEGQRAIEELGFDQDVLAEDLALLFASEMPKGLLE